MSISVLRTADAWWVATPAGAVKIATVGAHHRGTAGRSRRGRRGGAQHRHRRCHDLDLVSPVTTPCRVVAQMTNFASHVRDAGMDPKTIPLTFFRKSSASISGPFAPVRKPAHVKFLDYEVEIGLVIGRDMPVGTTISADRTSATTSRAWW